MPHIQVFADVRRSAESMWQEIGSFQCIARWHPMLTDAHGDGEEPGATRTLETVDGRRWEERLTEVDPVQRLYRYEVASSDLPIADFVGEFRVRDGGADKCTVVWTAQFSVTEGGDKEASDAVRRFFRAGARSIEDRYAVRAPRARNMRKLLRLR
ncbi:SRPBCC family protein [Mycobacterium sp. MMS18-G62]